MSEADKIAYNLGYNYGFEQGKRLAVEDEIKFLEDLYKVNENINIPHFVISEDIKKRLKQLKEQVK